MNKRTAETFTTEDRLDPRLDQLETLYQNDTDYRQETSTDGTTRHYFHRTLIAQVGQDILDQLAIEELVRRQIHIRDYRARHREDSDQ